MASHRRPRNPGRARISVLTAAAATTVALSATGGQSAQAAPKQTTAQLKAQIDKLNNDADAAVQQYDKAQSDQQALQKQINTLQDQVARQQASVTAKASVLGAIASAQYRSGAIDPSVQLMLSSDPTDYLNQASAQSRVADSQAAILADLKAEQATLDRTKADAEAKLKQLDATSKQLAAARATMQQRLDAAKAELDSLTAAQAAALKTAQDAADAQAKSSAQNIAAGHGSGSGAGSGGASGGGSSTSGASGPSAPGSSVGMAALAAAETQQGDPYQRGGTGPDRWDCSGLTQWAFAQAGVAIGRTTYDQIDKGTSVSLADIKVGDLVFFNNDSHVGIYAGGGLLFHAPHTGTVVKFEKMSEIGSIYAIRRI
ncbi:MULTISPECIES: C40 family peptidase [Streptacidiphilus]|uniref:NlpC/P60 family protein n=1 Tax=Streptacidiphilus cavernicola TaxID=3342716 RepID=A0ABV6UVT8_9ACTN|nr:C40 family peptidase [Streptacidiphilus jeojiense]